MGFTRSKHDYCLYIKLNPNDELILILYVDDLLVAGRNLSSIEKLKQDLAKIFEMSDCGELRRFLGIKIVYDYEAGVMQLSQATSIDRLMKRFGMSDCNPVEH